MTIHALPGIAEDDALERAVGVKRSLASMESDQWLYLLEFLDESAADANVRRICGAERIHPYGGDGTPDIPEFAVCEIAGALGLSNRAASSLVADILDIRHRLPQLFGCLRDGDLESYRVRMVAAASRDLDFPHVASVDERLSRRDSDQQPLLARLPRSKVFDVVEQIRRTHMPEEETEDEVAGNLDNRYVSLRQGGAGVEDLSGSLSTADARRLDQRVDQVADWLAELGDDRTKPVRRSVALGLLADSGAVADLWARVQEHRSGQPDSEPDHDNERTAESIDSDSAGDCVERADAAGAGVEAFVRPQPPTTILYIHLDRASGTWSLDGSGPITRGEALELLGHGRVTIKPVIDLAQTITYTGYAAPPKLKEQTALMNAGRCTFPHCTRSAWTAEYDHIVDHRARGPTDSRNGHRLCKHHHRAKTHTDWTVSSPAPGTWVWRSPRNRFFLVTAGTTTPLDLDVFRYAA